MFPTRRILLDTCPFDLLQLWQRLDDTIMGGQSNSKLEVTADGTAVWTGNLIVVQSCSIAVLHELLLHYPPDAEVSDVACQSVQ